MGKGQNERKLVYLVHRSIIFDSCIILEMLIKDIMPSIIFDSCVILGMLIKTLPADYDAHCAKNKSTYQFMCDLE